tara:strand:+ start:2485 stop:3363 length:879 start_codon:yes stop_codon:yes gene_type:complete
MVIDLTEMKSGFCDRLRLITYVVALSNIKNKKKRSLEILENQSKECPYLFSKHCKIKNFKLKRIKKISKNKISIKMNPYNSFPNEKNIKSLEYSKKIDSINFLSKWIAAYKLIEPKDKIKKKIRKLGLPKNYLGIHVRATDKMVSIWTKITEIPSKTTILKSQLNKFINHLDKIIQEQSYCKNIFLACDDQNLKIKLIKNLKHKNYSVYFNKTKFYKKRFRQTNAEDFLVDLFCLSNSKKIISSTGGGVPLTSSYISKNKIEVFNYVNKLNIYYIFNLISFFVQFIREIRKK